MLGLLAALGGAPRILLLCARALTISNGTTGTIAKVRLPSTDRARLGSIVTVVRPCTRVDSKKEVVLER